LKFVALSALYHLKSNSRFVIDLHFLTIFQIFENRLQKSYLTLIKKCSVVVIKWESSSFKNFWLLHNLSQNMECMNMRNCIFLRLYVL